MTSTRQRAANAQNARKARGPVTPKGKAASSLNAIKHGLNQKIDPLTHPVVEVIAKLYIEEGIEPDAARDLAQAHVERERIRSARIDVWRSEYQTGKVSERGKFYNTPVEVLCEITEFFGTTSWLDSMAHLFLSPYDSEVDRASDVATRILKRKSKLNRYEVHAVNQLGKAVNAAFLPLPKPAKIRKNSEKCAE